MLTLLYFSLICIGWQKRETPKRSLLESYIRKQQLQVPEKMNDLQRYLGEESLDPRTTGFDILLWWKVNGSKYGTLSLIAKDVLAIPMSTVASESAFSTSGRILDSFRSSLSPKTLEALVCTQSWLKVNHGGIHIKEYVDETQSYMYPNNYRCMLVDER